MPPVSTLPRDQFAKLFDTVQEAMTDPSKVNKSLADILKEYNVELELPPKATQTLSTALNTPLSTLASAEGNSCNGCGACAICILCEEINFGAGLIAGVSITSVA